MQSKAYLTDGTIRPASHDNTHTPLKDLRLKPLYNRYEKAKTAPPINVCHTKTNAFDGDVGKRMAITKAQMAASKHRIQKE